MGVYDDLKRLKIGKLFSDPGAFAGDVGKVASDVGLPATQTAGSLLSNSSKALALIKEKAARDGISEAEAADQLLRAGVIAGQGAGAISQGTGLLILVGLVALFLLTRR